MQDHAKPITSRTPRQQAEYLHARGLPLHRACELSGFDLADEYRRDKNRWLAVMIALGIIALGVRYAL